MLATAAARLRGIPALGQDVVLVLVLGAVQVALLGPVPDRPLYAALLAVEPVPLLLRRRLPTLTMALVCVIDVALVAADVPLHSVGASIVVAAYSAGAHQARSRAWTTLGIGAVAVVGIVVITGSRTGNADRIGVLLTLAVAWWIGTSLRERRAYAAQLERQAGELRAARTELAERAVADERLRLARELHDVVAHSLAIVALHSSVGAHNAATRPADAGAALKAINTASRTALTELRAILAVLREGGGPDVAPLPDLTDLSTLVDRAAHPGISVRATVSGAVDQVPKAVSLSAYRIVQEALTNVVKHAAPTVATVTVTVEPARVLVEVRNAGSNGHRRKSTTDGGSGIAGMRERVAIFGGDLSAGSAADGGWAVRANLPYEAAAGLA